jgi:hypothetical protein
LDTRRADQRALQVTNVHHAESHASEGHAIFDSILSVHVSVMQSARVLAAPPPPTFASSEVDRLRTVSWDSFSFFVGLSMGADRSSRRAARKLAFRLPEACDDRPDTSSDV